MQASIVFHDSTATLTPSPLACNSNNYDQYSINAQADDLTFNADAGSPQDEQKFCLEYKIKV